MKRFCTFLVLLTALIFLVTSVDAAEQTRSSSGKGFYIGILGGVVPPLSVGSSPNDGSASATVDIPVNTGYLAGAKVGWVPKIAKGYLATELEYNYVRYDSNKNEKFVTGTGTTASIDTTFSSHNGFLNFILRYPEASLHPYIGVGPGWSWINAANGTITTYGGGNVNNIAGGIATSQSANRFIYQLIAGIDFDITENFGIGIGYKFSQVKPYFNGPNTWNSDLEIKNHAITFGFKFSFL